MSRKEVVHSRPACVDPTRCGRPVTSTPDVAVTRGIFESIITTRRPGMNEYSLDVPLSGYGSTCDTLNDSLCMAQMSRGATRENDEPKANSVGSADAYVFRNK